MKHFSSQRNKNSKSVLEDQKKKKKKKKSHLVQKCWKLLTLCLQDLKLHVNFFTHRQSLVHLSGTPTTQNNASTSEPTLTISHSCLVHQQHANVFTHPHDITQLSGAPTTRQCLHRPSRYHTDVWCTNNTPMSSPTHTISHRCLVHQQHANVFTHPHDITQLSGAPITRQRLNPPSRYHTAVWCTNNTPVSSPTLTI